MDNKKNEWDHDPQNLIQSSNPLDFKTTQLDDELNEKLEEAFHHQTSQVILHDVAKIASEHDPIDLAYVVTRLPASSRIIVYDNLPDLNAKIIFMMNASNNTRSAIFKQLDDQEIKRLIEGMPADEAVWVLDDLSDRRLKRLFDILEPKKTLKIKELQKHDRHSAGRIMINEFFAFPLTTTIEAVSKEVRENPGIELTGRIFVLNEEGQVIGFVPERNLIINPSHLSIRKVMRPILHKVTAETSRDEAVDLIERYNISALPVINENGLLEGVISYEDAVQAMKDIADETIASIGGTSSEDYNDGSLYERFMGRAPWLLVTLCAGLFTATVMAHFQGRIWFAFLPFFVPLIAGMSGNVGIQCSTILVRGMSTGTISPGSIIEAIRKELGIGLLIGTIFGIGCGLIVYLLNYLGLHNLGISPWRLATTVSFGVLGACLVATALGTLSPLFFARCRIDPAVASGPIVTAFNDVLSTLMFFFIAGFFYFLIGS